MNYQLSFSKWMYLKNSWYKYFVSWMGTSLFLSMIMFINGKLSVTSSTVASIVLLLFNILMMINRVRTWKMSKVELNDTGVKFICIKADGYEANIELGRKRRIVTYSAFPIKKVLVSGKSIHVYGDVIVREQIYVNSLTKNKEKQISNFRIPPYFSNWNMVLEQLKKANGGFYYGK